MFTYDQIVEINKDYSPYYDLLNEGKDTWKRFIVTPQFFPLLNKTLDCLEKENISLWLQGAYGTGKSHATGYLKHLLWLPWEEVKDDVAHFDDVQVKHRLSEFRAKKRVLPVVMYGADKITNQIDFGLQVEVGVRSSLKKLGVELTTRTDFETYADKIHKDRSNYWDTMIEEEPDLNELVKDKKQMVSKLRAFDQDLFIAVRNISNKRGMPIAVPDIVAWLSAVCAQLREEGIADYIMIYWDEFTTILDKRNSEIHEYIQRIAEASAKSGVFLYLISHRTIAQGSSKDDRNKLLGRFNDSNYEMSNITTYLLMSNSIRKKDLAEWERCQEVLSEDLNFVIQKISRAEYDVDKKDLRDLFPIHPYTAHIATYIARVMGSTERSIFNFLFDERTGFKHFISKYPGKEQRDLLTVDYVFDFFEHVFKDLNEPFMVSVMQKLEFNLSSLQKMNKHYPALLKILLIMNIAHRKINLDTDHNDIVVPDEDNLNLAVRGSHLAPYVAEFLEYIDQKKILIRDHNDRFIVEAANFDSSDIEKWTRENRGKYSKISDIIRDDLLKKMYVPMTSNHKRKDAVRCMLKDSNESDHSFKQGMGIYLKMDNCLKFAVCVSHDYTQLTDMLNRAESLTKDADPGICFVVVDTLFTDNVLDKFLTYKAQNELAHSKHEDEAADTAQKNMNEHIRQWINEAVNQGFVTWYIKDKEGVIHTDKCGYRDLSGQIDSRIAPIAFHKSFDIMGKYVSVATAWEAKMAKKAAADFLSSTSLQDLLLRAKNSPSKTAAEILLDKDGAHLVNEKLEIISRPTEHPLIILMDRVKRYLDSNDEINIGDAFAPLFKPPYGYYGNHVFLAAMGFVFRKYVGKLYNPATGDKLNEICIIELIEKLFKYQCESKNSYKKDLFVRVGSENESKLVRLLSEIFDLEECSSITDARYKMADRLKERVKIPLWLLRFNSKFDEDTQVCIQMIASEILPINTGLSNLSPKQCLSLENDLLPYKNSLRQAFSGITDGVRNDLLITFGTEEIGEGYRQILMDGLPELSAYLSQRLQGDPVYWDEGNMLNAYNSWLLSKSRSHIATPPTSHVDDSVPGAEGGIIGDSSPKAQEVWEQVNIDIDATLSVLQELINEDHSFRQKLYMRLKELLK